MKVVQLKPIVIEVEDYGNPSSDWYWSPTYRCNVRKSWCREVTVEEPEVPGPYQLHTTDGILYANLSDSLEEWTIFGVGKAYKWEDFGDVTKATRLETTP